MEGLTTAGLTTAELTVVGLLLVGWRWIGVLSMVRVGVGWSSKHATSEILVVEACSPIDRPG